jgi:hypothetical protein
MSELSLLSGGKRKLDFDAAVGLLLAQSGFPVHARSCFISGPPAASLRPICSGDIHLTHREVGNRCVRLLRKDDRCGQ